MKKILIVIMVSLLVLASCNANVDVSNFNSKNSDVLSENTISRNNDVFEESTDSVESETLIESNNLISSELNSIASQNTSSQKTSSQTTSSENVPSRNSSSTISNISNSNSRGDSQSSEGTISVITEQDKMLSRLDEAIKERGIVNEGNRTRIANVMKKAQRGEPVTIGVIGGSITQGSSATIPSKSYAGIFKSWWQENFSSSTVTFVNAGLGGTGSFIGVHRLEADLLSKKPDLVIVEFAVNDQAKRLDKEAYESLIRRILKQSNNPGVILLFLMNELGGGEQPVQELVGANYDLPMISYKDAIWPKGGSRVYIWRDIAPPNDNVHPNNLGHAIIGELLKHYLNKVKGRLTFIPTVVSPLPSPITASGYENALLLTNKNLTATSLGGFTINNNAFWQFKNGWSVKNNTSPIVFNIKNAKNISLLYKKYTNGYGGVVSIKVNGSLVENVNSDFTGGWGENAETFVIHNGTEAIDYKIEIQLTSSAPKDEFTILGFLIS